MSRTVNDEFNGVADTLYIPLVSRIYVSKRFPDFFYDEKALSLEKYIPSDAIEKNSSEYTCMASACRQRVMDREIQKFLDKSPEGNVVFLGAGLETASDRIDMKKAKVYQVDLPDVICVREKALGRMENETLIPGDLFALDWAQDIDKSLPTMISVSGVYQYFHEEKIIQNIRAMKELFPKGELILDATNSDGLKFTNRFVQKTGNLDAMMYFGLDDPEEFCKKCHAELVSVSGFYADALKMKGRLKIMTRIFMYFTDKWKRVMVVHMRLNKSNGEDGPEPSFHHRQVL